MKPFTVDTVSDADKETMSKLENAVKESRLYKEYHLETLAKPYKVNCRTGEFTFTLSDGAYRVNDGLLKRTFLKLAGKLQTELETLFGGKGFSSRQDRSSRTFTIQRIGLHNVVKKNVPKSFAIGSCSETFGKVVRFAELLSKLNPLTERTTFCVQFFRRDENGKTLNESYTVAVQHVNTHRDNYEAAIITESARLIREITDIHTYGGFSPDFARIVANDTGDTYNLEL